MAKKIVIKDLKACHPNAKASQTDMYYMRLANKIQDQLSKLAITADTNNEEVIHRGAILLTSYMEDIVADSGVWRTFSNLCMDLYDHPVPLFHEEEEYYPDEPSLNAVRFLLWIACSDVTDSFVFSDSDFIDIMAITAFSILDEAFEEAPVNEQLAEDIEAMLRHAMKGFDELRTALKWLYNNCYLISGENNDILIDKHVNEMLSMSEKGTLPLMPLDMAFYYASTRCIFLYKIGHLALYPKDFLAAMMRTKGMQQQSEDVESIEFMDFGTYKVESIESSSVTSRKAPAITRVKLTRTNGKQIDINAQELNLPYDKELEDFEGYMATSFVFYQGEWHLNGILMPIDHLKEKWDEICKDDPDYMEPGKETLTGEMLLERTGGQQIAYFADREELKEFLVEKIRFPLNYLDFIDERGGELPTVFIDTEEPKNCLQFFYGYSPCIADPDNPFYDKEKARESAINMLWNARCVTTNAVNYMLEHGFLPDIYEDKVLSTFSTKEEKRKDINFLMRYYRRENY
ncbi:MAG: DUF3843 family protein [Prevotella sp.]